MPKDLPNLKPGDVLTAAYLNTLRDWVMRCQIRVANGCGLELLSGPDGDTISLAGSDPLWIKVTAHGTGGKYAWTEQVPSGEGTWADGERTGTTSDDPAYHANGKTDVATPSIHFARYTDLGTLYFGVAS